MTLLIGDTTVYASGNVNESAGQISAYIFTALETGTVEELQLRTASTANASTGLILAIYADSSGVPGALLGYGTTTSLPTSSWVSVTGLSIPVVQGTSYWLAAEPLGGTFHYPYGTTAGTYVYYTDGYEITYGSPPPSPWPAANSATDTPFAVGFQGLGTLGTPAPSGPAITPAGLEFHVTGLWKPGASSVPYYGRLSDPQAAEVVIPLNDSRTASVTVSTHDPVVETLAALPQQPYAIHLKAYYNGTLVFWGPVKVRAPDFASSTVRFDAVDMSLRLIHDHIHEGDLLLGDGQVDPATGKGYLPVSHEGLRLLRDAAQTESFPSLGIDNGTNTFVPDPNAIMGVQRGDQLWNTWIQMCQALGPDFELEPVENHDQAYAVLNTFDKQGTDRSASVQLHYGMGLSNLEALSFTEGEEYTNIAHVLDRELKYRETVTNATALTRTAPYGEFDATDFDAGSGVTEAHARAVLNAYATEIIKARGVPLVQAEVTLPPDTVDGLHYLTDFKVGDTVSVAGKDGFVEMPESLFRVTTVRLSREGESVRQGLELIPDRTVSDTISGTDPEA